MQGGISHRRQRSSAMPVRIATGVSEAHEGVGPTRTSWSGSATRHPGHASAAKADAPASLSWLSIRTCALGVHETDMVVGRTRSPCWPFPSSSSDVWFGANDGSEFRIVDMSGTSAARYAGGSSRTAKSASRAATTRSPLGRSMGDPRLLRRPGELDAGDAGHEAKPERFISHPAELPTLDRKMADGDLIG